MAIDKSQKSVTVTKRSVVEETMSSSQVSKHEPSTSIINKTLNMTEIQNLTQEKVLSYEEAFSRIEKATGISDTDLLVNNFIKAEERNFALFTFVNEQSHDIDNIEGQIGDLTDEVDRIKATGVSRVSTGEQVKRKDLRTLETQLKQLEDQIDGFVSKNNSSYERLEQVMACV